MVEYTLEGATGIIEDLEAELRKEGIGAWFHRPATAVRTHCVLLRVADVAEGSCPFVVSATGATDYVAIQKAVDAWRASVQEAGG
jgi:hypothetical protein